jgi:hypothetical protein
LLKFLKSQPNTFWTTLCPLSAIGKEFQSSPQVLKGYSSVGAPLEELERIVADRTTPRSILESIAITRFSVPRGSMRTFMNKEMLINKLEILIENERTHLTIGAVARGNAKESRHEEH